jgi:PASTA domain-containing protein
MREQMKALDDFEMGDQWELVQRRIPGSEGPEPPHQRRGVRPSALFVGSIVVIGLVLFGLRALGEPKPGSAVGPGDIVRYHLDGPPQPISVGEGAAWVKIGSGSETTNGIVRIDAQTGEQQMLDTPGGDWTAVGGGYAWLICNSADCITSAQHAMDPFDVGISLVAGSVIRIDPVTGKIVGYTPLYGRGLQIVGTPDGVWVSTDVGVYFVHADGSWTKHFPLKGGNLIGADQTSVWVSGGGGLMSLDPQSGQQLARVSFQDPCTMEVAAGMVWVASCQGQGDRLMGIDSSTGDVLFDRPIQGYGQMRYANGVLWLAQRDPNDQSSIQLVAFGPRTGDPMGSPITIPPSNQEDRFPFRAIVPAPIFFAVGEGSFWLTDFSAGEVIRMGIPNAPTTGTPDSGSVQTVSVPELVGLDVGTAKAKLEHAGLAIETSKELSADPYGSISRQSPSPGTMVAPGDTVHLVVSVGLPGNDLGALGCPSGEQSATSIYPPTDLKLRAPSETVVGLVRRTFSGILATDQVTSTTSEAGENVVVTRSGAVIARAFLMPHLNGYLLAEVATCASSGVDPPSRSG